MFIEKQFFNDLENIEKNLKLSMDGFKDYSLIINERGESFESTAFGYSKFNNCLSKLGITNRVFVFTECETDSYLKFIKEFNWTPVTYYGFLMTQSFNGEWDMQLHIPKWIYDKLPNQKEVSFIKKFLTFNSSVSIIVNSSYTVAGKLDAMTETNPNGIKNEPKINKMLRIKKASG